MQASLMHQQAADQDHAHVLRPGWTQVRWTCLLEPANTLESLQNAVYVLWTSALSLLIVVCAF